MSEIQRQHIPWHPSPDGGSLGRNLVHDPASRAYPVTRTAEPIVSRLWRRRVGIYQQGDTGSCTGNAMAGCLSTRPFGHRFHEYTARRIYHQATVLDGIDGVWPPTDTGSSSLAVLKVARNHGWIGSYRWCFSIDDVLTAMQTGPVIAGTLWLTGMDRPDSSGRVSATGDVRGGHEYCLVGLDVAARTIRAANSWGDDWGDHGYFDITWDDFASLMARQGDVGVPVA